MARLSLFTPGMWRPVPRVLALASCAILCLVGCDDDTVSEPIIPDAAVGDGGPEFHPPDAGVRPEPKPNSPTSASCDNDTQCAGGACFGSKGSLTEGDLLFQGGYCTTLGCTLNTQVGCGPDEWCLDVGDGTTYCVTLCSKADGMTCARPDHACLGLGTWGGCFSVAAVECNAVTKAGCKDGELCVRIGFEDKTLGRCEKLCDDPEKGTAGSCPDGNACYYIRRYNAAFCGDPGTQAAETPCTCDKCCEPGYACTPDLDGAGKHCKPYCKVAEGCSGGTCEPLEAGSPFGGCIAPGSAGT